MKTHSHYQVRLAIGAALRENRVARSRCKNSGQRKGWDRQSVKMAAERERAFENYKRNVNTAIAADPWLANDPDSYVS